MLIFLKSCSSVLRYFQSEIKTNVQWLILIINIAHESHEYCVGIRLLQRCDNFSSVIATSVIYSKSCIARQLLLFFSRLRGSTNKSSICHCTTCCDNRIYRRARRWIDNWYAWTANQSIRMKEAAKNLRSINLSLFSVVDTLHVSPEQRGDDAAILFSQWSPARIVWAIEEPWLNNYMHSLWIAAAHHSKKKLLYKRSEYCQSESRTDHVE